MSAGFSFGRRLAAEALGTGLLVATVVGSGIMAEQLAGGNVAIALLGNTIATGAILVVLILAFGPISGAHFNPAVSIVMGITGGLPWREVGPYALAQVIGGCLGTLAAHGMFDLQLFQLAGKARTGPAQWFAEFVATFGLLITILAVVRFRARGDPVRCRALHHRGLLVHGLDLVRQPGGHGRTRPHRHICRHRAEPCDPVRARADGRGARRHGPDPLAASGRLIVRYFSKDR